MAVLAVQASITGIIGRHVISNGIAGSHGKAGSAGHGMKWHGTQAGHGMAWYPRQARDGMARRAWQGIAWNGKQGIGWLGRQGMSWHGMAW